LASFQRRAPSAVAASPHRAARTPAEPTFQELRGTDGARAFPVALDPFVCTRGEMAGFALAARDAGARYIGICCGGAPHHVRAMAEALGRTPPSSRYSPDMAHHPVLGDAPGANEQRFANWRD
jgi:betaine-homocysteine S-methyltransferase